MDWAVESVAEGAFASCSIHLFDRVLLHCSHGLSDLLLSLKDLFHGRGHVGPSSKPPHSELVDIDGFVSIEVQLLHRLSAFFLSQRKTNVLGELHELNCIDVSTLVLVELEESLDYLILVAS
jgi:hypothetical protein